MGAHWTLGCDANDPQRLASFWAMALGYVLEPGFDEPNNASIIGSSGAGPAIGFLQVPEGKEGENRMHIDIRVAGQGPWDMDERATPACGQGTTHLAAPALALRRRLSEPSTSRPSRQLALWRPRRRRVDAVELGRPRYR